MLKGIHAYTKTGSYGPGITEHPAFTIAPDPTILLSAEDLICLANLLSHEKTEGNALSRIVPSVQYQKNCVRFADEAPGTPPIPWRLLECPSGISPKGCSPQAPGHQPSVLHACVLPSTKPRTPVKKRPVKGCGPIFKNSSEQDQLDEIDFSELADAGLEESMFDGNFQTLMIKHIPCRCTRKEVLDAIADVGFAHLYNFFHLPVRRVNQRNFGYAFIGFPTPEITSKFALAMTGYRWSCRCSTKECEVAPARIQGFSDNMNHFLKAEKKAQCMRRRLPMQCKGALAS